MLSRVSTRSGVSIPAHQHAGDYAPAKTEVVIVPSTNTPSWGAMFTVDYKEKGVTLHNLTLQFNLSAITVMTSGMYVPAQFFVDHIDYVMNGAIIDTYYPNDQFLQAQLFERDEDRALLNTAAGLYSSTSQRTTLAASASSYYLPLRDFFRQAKGDYPVGTSSRLAVACILTTSGLRHIRHWYRNRVNQFRQSVSPRYQTQRFGN